MPNLIEHQILGAFEVSRDDRGNAVTPGCAFTAGEFVAVVGEPLAPATGTHDGFSGDANVIDVGFVGTGVGVVDEVEIFLGPAFLAGVRGAEGDELAHAAMAFPDVGLIGLTAMYIVVLFPQIDPGNPATCRMADEVELVNVVGLEGGLDGAIDLVQDRQHGATTESGPPVLFFEGNDRCGFALLD